MSVEKKVLAICAYLCVLTARSCLLTPLQQLSKAMLPIPALFHSLLRLLSDTIPSFNSQSQTFSAKTPPPHPALGSGVLLSDPEVEERQP